MAVAVKNSPESTTRSAAGTLVPASIAGAVFVVACLAVIFWGVPRLWEMGVAPHLANLSFVSYAVLIVFEAVAIAALAYAGNALVGTNPPAGLRAGIFSVLAWVFLTGVVTILAGRIFELFLSGAPAVGLALTAAVGLALFFWGWSLLMKPRTPDWLRAFENQGWFSSNRLKPMQGQRVRRATMLGIILLVGAGVYSLMNNGTLNTAGYQELVNGESVQINTWRVLVPFTTDRFIYLLPDVKYTVPLLLAAAGLWLAFRVVHMPVFADFLIATEAELNKVSWPVRRSVIQDTIVVLTTVLLLTVFLFLVDIGWGWLLSRNVVGVIRQSDTPKTPSPVTNVDKTPY
jgi:preprotein translocase SecE subunit